MFANVHTIDLKEIYGEKWEGCKFYFSPLPFRDLMSINSNNADEAQQGAALVDLLSDKFISGKALTQEGDTKEVTQEDFDKYFLEPRFVNKAGALMMNAYSADEGLSAG